MRQGALDTVKNCRWIVLLAGFSLLGCASGVTASSGAWPWEYGGDYGKAQTGNYVGLSGAVAKFGDAPVAPKTANAESVRDNALQEKVSEEKSAPPSKPAANTRASLGEPGAARSKNAYDFTVRDIKNLPPNYVPDGSVDLKSLMTRCLRYRFLIFGIAASAGPSTVNDFPAFGMRSCANFCT